jgi:hypothetical protein
MECHFKKNDRVVHLFTQKCGIVVGIAFDEQRDEYWCRVLYDGENFYRATPDDYLRPETLQ